MISVLKNNQILFYRLAILIVLASLFTLPISAFAQQSLALSVSPTLFEMSANPGQLWKSSVKVINSNPYELTVYASVVNFEPQGETGQGKLMPVFAEMTEGATLAEWVEITSEPIVIPQEQSFEIPFFVEVPEDASPGGHFAAILISTQPPNDPNVKNLSVKTAQIVSSLFFVRVSGDVKESGVIRSFSTTKSLVETPEVNLELRFENKGNVHLQPRGDIKIYNLWGTERGVIPINHQTHFGNVLPDSIRKFEFAWKGESSFTDIGRYKAVASLAYGLGDRQFVSSATYFWVIPIKPLLFTITFLIALFYAVSWGIKLYIRRMLQLAGVSIEESVQSPEKERDRKNDVRVSAYSNATAPMRFGWQDLRERLREVKVLMDVIKVFVSFVVSYKLFFLAVLVLIAVVSLLVYFIKDATSTEKSFDVVINNPDASLNLSSEEIKYQALSTEANLPPLGLLNSQGYELILVNTSGVSGTAASEAINLVQAGYAVLSLGSDENRLDKKTVIVFDPALQEEALAISKKLGGALLSARQSTSTEDKPNITVFVGGDRIKE